MNPIVLFIFCTDSQIACPSWATTLGLGIAWNIYRCIIMAKESCFSIGFSANHCPYVEFSLTMIALSHKLIRLFWTVITKLGARNGGLWIDFGIHSSKGVFTLNESYFFQRCKVLETSFLYIICKFTCENVKKYDICDWKNFIFQFIML